MAVGVGPLAQVSLLAAVVAVGAVIYRRYAARKRDGVSGGSGKRDSGTLLTNGKREPPQRDSGRQIESSLQRADEDCSLSDD